MTKEKHFITSTPDVIIVTKLFSSSKMLQQFIFQAFSAFPLGARVSLLQNISLQSKYHILSSIMHIQVLCAPEFQNDFWQKKLFLFFKNDFKRINHCKFIHHKGYLKPFLSYLPCIVHREYFSIIFNVKKCALCLIKYDTWKIQTL